MGATALLGTRLAVAGKGGAGKTTIAGTLARALATRGYPLLALDGDLNPNLGLTLGLPREAFDAGEGLPRDLVVHVESPEGAGLSLTIPFDEVLERYGQEAPGGIRLLTMGRPTAAGGG